MDMVALKVTARPQEARAKVLRTEGQVPCVLYGNDVENTAVQCEHNDLFRAYAKAGESTLVDLDVDGKKVPVLFHAIDMDPVSDKITHVDFFAVDMKKEIEAKVPVHFTGEAPAVKDLGGVLVTAHDHVVVKCLPTNLPHALDASLEKLTEFGISLSVADLRVPDGVMIIEGDDVVLATVQEPRKDEEPEPEVAEGEAAGGETAEGEAKGEEAEKKEGEAAAKEEGEKS